MRLLAIDPGTTESAYVLCETAAGGKLVAFAKVPNIEMLYVIESTFWTPEDPGQGADRLAIELVASYGMPVGAEVFETCIWIGRFIECWGGEPNLIRLYRKDVKAHLCRDSRAKDGNVRQAIIDRYGGKDKAIGNKKAPGPLHGVSGDVWSALAIAITAQETVPTVEVPLVSDEAIAVERARLMKASGT